MYIKATWETPEVYLENQTLSIKGRSVKDKSAIFFLGIIACIKDAQITRANIKLSLFDISTSRKLLEIFRILEKEWIKKKDSMGETKPIIYFYYNEDDEDMEDAGEEFRSLLRIGSFKLVKQEN